MKRWTKYSGWNFHQLHSPEGGADINKLFACGIGTTPRRLFELEVKPLTAGSTYKQDDADGTPANVVPLVETNDIMRRPFRVHGGAAWLCGEGASTSAAFECKSRMDRGSWTSSPTGTVAFTGIPYEEIRFSAVGHIEGKMLGFQAYEGAGSDKAVALHAIECSLDLVETP